MECGDVKKNWWILWKKVEFCWVPCKARCPVVSPGHFSLLKILTKSLPASSFQLGDWLRSSSLRLGNHFHQSAIHCSTLQGRGSLMAKVSNQFPEKIHHGKKIDLQASWHACWYTASQIQCEDSHNTRRSTGWPYALPSHGSKTQCEKTCTTTMLLPKSGQKSDLSIVMEVEDERVVKGTSLGGIHFSLPWLWEDECLQYVLSYSHYESKSIQLNLLRPFDSGLPSVKLSKPEKYSLA